MNANFSAPLKLIFQKNSLFFTILKPVYLLYSYTNSYLYLIYLYTGTVILKRFISIEAFSIFRIYNQQVSIAMKLILYFFCLILSYFSSCRFFIIKLQFCSDSFCKYFDLPVKYNFISIFSHFKII